MPKIIAGLSETITDTGRQVLFSEGYEAMSMRRVAQECGIAVGTIYNYVQNKRDLLIQIVNRDWHRRAEHIRSCIDENTGFTEGILMTYREFIAFKEEYAETFRSVLNHSEQREMPYTMHPQLTAEIAGIIAPLLECRDYAKQQALNLMVAEMILAAAQHPLMNEETLRITVEALDIT